MKPVRIVVMGLVVCVAAAAAGPVVNLLPGKYEVDTESQLTMHGNSQTNHQAKATRCLTTAQLEDPEQVFNERFVANYHPDKSCTQQNLKASATAVVYDEECTNRTVHVEATLSGTAYSVSRKVVPKDPRSPLLDYKITGKRVGECP